ncbi:bacillithiol biosynthesis deacetylase BshB1 [Microscilla marina]|uniref:YpjG n=1 Tax=Microscilla marina ATCC 23134 TaxID=313606 RepID=A1ZDT6_MICM2|nr:bacillithiol biosynthesis deacetylase BshB1 [Microscilla marina]EAY31244.1 YpjG [Microscilla marina ATCC 23134]
MKLDILALGVHPDDVELACSGTVISHINRGKKVGIVDFTRGELGTRGTAETRKAESEAASKILGVEVRENLEMADGFFQNDKAHQLKLIAALRKFQPEIVLANALDDRHSDHGRAAKLAIDACFYAGLVKVETLDAQGNIQAPWRPKQIYHYVQDRYMKPDLIVDVTPFWEQRMEAVKAFKTQFFISGNEDNEPATPISTPDFMLFLEARAREFGRLIGVKYGEGFVSRTPIGTTNLFELK